MCVCVYVQALLHTHANRSRPQSNDECVDPYFLMNTSGVWNGISLACIDVAKKHVTRKAHADVGMRVCDYPTIQVSMMLISSYFNLFLPINLHHIFPDTFVTDGT